MKTNNKIQFLTNLLLKNEVVEEKFLKKMKKNFKSTKVNLIACDPNHEIEITY